MTYGQLSKAKSLGFETNHIIDDAVNNARFSYGKNLWESEEVSANDMLRISHFAKKEGVEVPLTHTQQLCLDATAYGEGCPTDNCKCSCHNVTEEDEMERILALNEAIKIIDAASTKNCREAQAIYDITFHASRYLNKQIIAALKETI